MIFMISANINYKKISNIDITLSSPPVPKWPNEIVEFGDDTYRKRYSTY
jgi:hypothetical protein